MYDKNSYGSYGVLNNHVTTENCLQVSAFVLPVTYMVKSTTK